MHMDYVAKSNFCAANFKTDYGHGPSNAPHGINYQLEESSIYVLELRNIIIIVNTSIFDVTIMTEHF